MRYDPRVQFPALTNRGEQELRVLVAKNTRRQTTEDMQLQRFIAEAVLAAAVNKPIRTVGEAWDVVAFRSSDVRYRAGHPGRSGLQAAFMQAAQKVIKEMK